MFSKNLLVSVRRLFEMSHLSCEDAARRCGVSAGYFRSILSGKSTPSLAVLEKLCRGFQVTPDDLLLGDAPWITADRLSAKTVDAICRVGGVTYPICPGCGHSIEHEFQHYCDRCGQLLDWKKYPNAVTLVRGI